MSQFISLQNAVDITSRFRSNKENILDNAYKNQGFLPICESFDREQIDDLLSQNDCTGIRIYFSMDGNYKVKVAIVAYDSNNEDILVKDEEKIAEDGTRCPTNCPPSSPLNS